MKRAYKAICILLISSLILNINAYSETCPSTIEETVEAVKKSEASKTPVRTPASRPLPEDRIHGMSIGKSELPPALQFLAEFKAEILNPKKDRAPAVRRTREQGKKAVEEAVPRLVEEVEKSRNEIEEEAALEQNTETPAPPLKKQTEFPFARKEKESDTGRSGRTQESPARRETHSGGAQYQTAFDFEKVINTAKLDILAKSGIFTKLLYLGQHKHIVEFINDVMHRLYMEGDDIQWTVSVSGNPIPNAFIRHGGIQAPHIEITTGLISFCKNVDELAGVIAHEMTHGNPDHLRAATDSQEIADILKSVESVSKLEPKQREEIRADLGAIERLIKAGFNPYAHYDFEKRISAFYEKTMEHGITKYLYRKIFKQSMEFHSTHPASEVRMAAAKSFLSYLSKKRDLADNLGKYKPFKWRMRLLRMRTQIYTAAITSKWFRRGITGYGLYYLLSSLGVFDSTGVAGSIKNHFYHMDPDTFFHRALGTVAAIAVVSLPALFYFGWKDARESAQFTKRKIESSWEARKQRDYEKEMLDLTQQYEIALNKKMTLKNIRHLLKISNTYLQRLMDFFFYNRKEIEDSDYKAYLNPAQLLLKAKTYHRGLLLLLIGELEKLPARKRVYEIAKANRLIKSIPRHIVEDRETQELLIRYEKLRKGSEYYITEIIQKAGAKHLKLQPAELAVAIEFFPKNASPRKALVFLEKLYNYDLLDSATAIYDTHIAKIIKYVFSDANTDPGNIRLLREIIDRIRVYASRRKRLDPEIKKWNRKILYIRLLSIFTSKDYKITAKSLAIDIPHVNRILNYDFMSINHWLKKRDRRAIIKHLSRSYSSITELREFAETVLKKQGALMEHLSDIFSEVILSHPEWIKTPEDIEALLASEYFWPAFNASAIKSGDLEESLSNLITYKAMEFPKVWKYDIAASERLHMLIFSKLKEFGLEPKTETDKYRLWRTLTNRGITSITDTLFEEIYTSGNTSRKSIMRSHIDSGKLWNPVLKERVVIENLQQDYEYRSLIQSEDARMRRSLLERVIKKIQRAFPERGNAYLSILEEISVKINSTPEESALIHKAKSIESGERSEDLAIRTFSDILTKALKWKRKHQWELILFLRGDIKATKKIKRAFQFTGHERVRRLYSTLPVIVKAGLIDGFIDPERGLVPNVNTRKGYAKKIINHVTRNSDPEIKKVIEEILEGFFVGIEKASHPSMKSYVLSYLLAMPGGDSSAGETLKNVLEIFGTTGVKIGQFLVASGILPDKIAVVLRQLQEKANVPERETIYRDLREIFNGRDVPARILNLLGAASLKYAMLGMDRQTKEYFVLKVLRLDAIVHTRMEFNMLDVMANHLNRKYGGSYGIFRSIVRASREAVERELELQSEVYWGEKARIITYANSSDLRYKVSVPRELLLHDRVIAAEYAEGVSIFDIKEKYRAGIARKIILMEKKIYMEERDASHQVIIFDPDRHPGNYRIMINKSSQGPPENNITFTIHPIDFGQMLSITMQDKSRIFDLFALSHILKETGSTKWLAQKIIETMNIRSVKVSKLRRALKKYFPTDSESPVTPYYSVLSALEDVGYKAPITYFDYIRGIISMNNWEVFLDKGHTIETPKAKLEKIIRARAGKFVDSMELTTGEKLRIGLRRKWYKKKKKQ